MKILITTLNSRYIHTNIAIRYIYKMLKEQDEDVHIKEFTINDELHSIIANITDINPNKILFSTYIWNVELTLKISKILKTIKPNIRIVLGGPEVTYNLENFLNKHKYIDEISITNIENLDILPRVAEDLVKEDKCKIIYFESSRGCPYNCSYCLSSIDKGIKEFDINRVKEEIKIFIDNDIKLVKFIDRTFNYSKIRALEIWKYIVENNKDTEFHFEIAAHLIDDEMLDFLKTVPKGMFRFEIGIQSTNEETIKSINRNTNFKTIKKIVEKINSFNNITMHLDLIAGLPYETYEIFKKSFNDVYNLKGQELQLGFLKLLNGCKIREEADLYEYKYIDFPPYEILENKFIKYEEIKNLKRIERVLDKYYNKGTFKNSLEYIINNSYNSPFDFFAQLADYYLEKKHFERLISGEESFDILYEFYIENIKKDVEEFLSILKQDYYNKYKNKRYWI